MAKTHWANKDHAVCGVKHGAWVVGAEDLRDVSTEGLRQVTCVRCAKKLTEFGFALQHFTEDVQQAVMRLKK